jgi:hypothetical protein
MSSWKVQPTNLLYNQAFELLSYKFIYRSEKMVPILANWRGYAVTRERGHSGASYENVVAVKRGRPPIPESALHTCPVPAICQKMFFAWPRPEFLGPSACAKFALSV